MRKFILLSSYILSCLALLSIGQIEKAVAAPCKGGDKLGVHRTVNLNTLGGARYGSSHGRDRAFLRDKEVVLTFDDGPMAGKTTKVLHELEQHCAKATFFMVATMAKNNPSLAYKVAAKGHTVGIHSYSHKNLAHLGGSAAISDVDRSIKIIKDAVGPKTAPFFRFPYLSENKAVNHHLGNQDYGVFAIDVDSLDYRMPSSSAMVNRVMSELSRHGKGIILLHDIQNVTANGLGSLLTRLHDEGYKLVHIKGRGGREIPDTMHMADASNHIKEKSVRQELLARDLDRVAKRPKARNAVKQRPKAQTSVAKLVDDTDQNEVERAAFLFSKAFRSSIKKRIVEARPTKSANQDNSRPTRLARIEKAAKSSRSNTTIKKQIERNKALFRKSLKLRLITN